jgi:hypothetical protein
MHESEFHINYQRMAQEFAVKKSGCVCRAIASITQTTLTESQKNLRIDQVNDYQDERRRLNNLEYSQEVSDQELQQMYKQIIELKISQIKDYISSIQNQSDTPAGRHLSLMEIETQNITPKDIRRLYKKGRRVMIIIPGHAMHIEPKGKHKFISQSDGGCEVKLKSKKYPAFIFAPNENI